MILSANMRKFILKVPFAREVSNLIVNISNEYFYKKINKNEHNDKKIKAFKNSRKGKRCFIVGNGPSLTVEQLEKIRDEDSFGANRIFKLFDKTRWRPRYYIIQDKYDSTKGVYETLDVENLFVSDFYWKEHGMKNPHAICYHTKRLLRQSDALPFSEECSLFIQSASTVPFTMIQLACYMGYSEIYLIGMDHTYANVTNDKGSIIKRNQVKNHVFDDEKPNEVVANISYMEAAYRTARIYCEKHGIKICNATHGGALEIFERIDFGDVIGRQR